MRDENAQPGHLPLRRQAGVARLQSIYLGAEEPAHLDIWNDCSLRWASPVPGLVSFAFGSRTTPALLSEARRYAEDNKLIMLTLHIGVRPRHLSQRVPWDELGKRDMGMVSTDQLPRRAADELASLWLKWTHEETGLSLAKLTQKANWTEPSDFVARYPLHLPKILDTWRLEVFVHPVKLAFTDFPVMVASMRPRAVEMVSAETTVFNLFPAMEIAF